VTPLTLAALAVVLSGPVPAALARVPAVRHAPRAAVTLWQAVALAAVLSALGAGLALTTDRVLDGEVGPADVLVAAAAVAVTAVVLGRLLVVGHRVGTHLRARRRRHREAVELLGQRDERWATGSGRVGVLVLEGRAVAAYCLPAMLRRRIVISRAVSDLLTEDQLAAVVAHEQAHLAARHDLVLEAFTVLHRAFPRLVSSSRALEEVRLLVEVLADAAARRRHGALPLAQALAALVDARTPAVALAASGSSTQLVIRVRLLTRRPRRLGLLALETALYAASVAVLALPSAFVVAPWLTAL
jgi:beta-lactamase regulating signal transducer with metallopeptidase domain